MLLADRGKRIRPWQPADDWEFRRALRGGGHPVPFVDASSWHYRPAPA